MDPQPEFVEQSRVQQRLDQPRTSVHADSLAGATLQHPDGPDGVAA
jgi:hypothetical protein